MKSDNMSNKIDNLLNILKKYKNLGIIFTYPNSDKRKFINNKENTKFC